MPRSPFNLDSPNQIREACALHELDDWFSRELVAISDDAIRSAVQLIVRNCASFVRFPQTALLLWAGSDRVPNEGAKQKYFRYPPQLASTLKAEGIALDTRANGPAIAAFKFAGGERPIRFGSTNAWSIHHLYSGKYPFPGKTETLHAPKDGFHFTQSAGLVAAHPLADALCDEFPAFSWFLRAHAFKRFGYDPDGVFSDHPVGRLGFVDDSATKVVFSS